MKDTIRLAIGDTTVPFAEYEGDTAAYCRGIHDAFSYLGIDSEVSETIVHFLEEKPMRVQKVFLLRVAGKRTGEIADITGIPGRTVRRYAHESIEDVRRFLRDWVKPIPEHTWPN